MKLDLRDPVQTRVLPRGPYRHRIMIESKNFFRAKFRRGQRENSTAGAEVGQRPPWLQFARNLFEQSQRHRGGSVPAGAERGAGRDDKNVIAAAGETGASRPIRDLQSLPDLERFQTRFSQEAFEITGGQLLDFTAELPDKVPRPDL